VIVELAEVDVGALRLKRLEIEFRFMDLFGCMYLRYRVYLCLFGGVQKWNTDNKVLL